MNILIAPKITPNTVNLEVEETRHTVSSFIGDNIIIGTINNSWFHGCLMSVSLTMIILEITPQDEQESTQVAKEIPIHQIKEIHVEI